MVNKLTSMGDYGPTRLGDHLKNAQLIDVVLADEAVGWEFQVFTSWPFAYLRNHFVSTCPNRYSRPVDLIATYDILVLRVCFQYIDDLLQSMCVG